MTADTSKTVFISYRRSVSSFIARAIFMDLREHGYDVFMDVESIDSGAFDTIILNQIAARAHFLLVLTPDTLERCAEREDWLRREIEYAMDLQRNIVPLLVGDFKFDDQNRRYLTSKLNDLPRYNALTVPHDYFEAAMDKLRNRFLKQPLYGTIQPTPAKERGIVQGRIAKAVNRSQNQETAEEYYRRGRACSAQGEYDNAIKNYTEAIHLNPQYVDAYTRRGGAYYYLGDYDEAIKNANEALRLDPQHVLAYNNRGVSYVQKGDYRTALANFEAALRIDPNHEQILFNYNDLLKKMGHK